MTAHELLMQGIRQARFLTRVGDAQQAADILTGELAYAEKYGEKWPTPFSLLTDKPVMKSSTRFD